MNPGNSPSCGHGVLTLRRLPVAGSVTGPRCVRMIARAFSASRENVRDFPERRRGCACGPVGVFVKGHFRSSTSCKPMGSAGVALRLQLMRGIEEDNVTAGKHSLKNKTFARKTLVGKVRLAESRRIIGDATAVVCHFSGSAYIVYRISPRHVNIYHSTKPFFD